VTKPSSPVNVTGDSGNKVELGYDKNDQLLCVLTKSNPDPLYGIIHTV